LIGEGFAVALACSGNNRTSLTPFLSHASPLHLRFIFLLLSPEKAMKVENEADMSVSGKIHAIQLVKVHHLKTEPCI